MIGSPFPPLLKLDGGVLGTRKGESVSVRPILRPRTAFLTSALFTEALQTERYGKTHSELKPC